MALNLCILLGNIVKKYNKVMAMDENNKEVFPSPNKDLETSVVERLGGRK